MNELWELSNMTFLVTLTYISKYLIERHIYYIDISWTNLTVLLLVDFTLFFDIDLTIIYFGFSLVLILKKITVQDIFV